MAEENGGGGPSFGQAMTWLLIATVAGIVLMCGLWGIGGAISGSRPTTTRTDPFRLEVTVIDRAGDRPKPKTEVAPARRETSFPEDARAILAGRKPASK